MKARASVLCSNNRGLDIVVKNIQRVGVRGRATDRGDRGRLGPRGSHGVSITSPPNLFFGGDSKLGKIAVVWWEI